MTFSLLLCQDICQGTFAPLQSSQTLQWTGVRNSLFLVGCQTLLPSKIHNVLQSIRYQGTRYGITPNLSFEVGKINNSLHIKKEDTKRQKKDCIFHSPVNIIYDYTLQFLLRKSISEMFLIRNFITLTMWNGGPGYAEERTQIDWHCFLTKGKKSGWIYQILARVMVIGSF